MAAINKYRQTMAAWLCAPAAKIMAYRHRSGGDNGGGMAATQIIAASSSAQA